MGIRHGYVTATDGGRLEFRRIGVARSLSGLLILLLAWGLFGLGRDAIGQPTTPAGISPWITFAAAIAAAAAGSAMLTYRSGITFDRARDDVCVWSGFLRPQKTERFALSNFREVFVRREVRTTYGERGSSTVIVFVVTLVSADGGDPIEILAPKDAMAARRLAESISRATGLRLRSAVTDSASHTVREAHELDWGLRQQLEASQTVPSEPALPPGSRIRTTVDDRGVTAELPRVGILRGGLGVTLFGLPGVILFGAFGTSFMERIPEPVMWVIWGVIATPLVLMAIAGLTRGLQRETITANARELRIVRCGLVGRRTIDLCSGDIEELTWARNPAHLVGGMFAAGGVTATTDEAMTEFGLAASDEERVYLVELIKHAVCSGPPSPAHAAVVGA